MYVDTKRYTLKERLIVALETLLQLFTPVLVLFMVLALIAGFLAIGMWIFSGVVHFQEFVSWMSMLVIVVVPVLVLLGIFVRVFWYQFTENLVDRFGRRR
ncbi:hypothetical protein [Acidithiobacillus caldus]|jgi:energy-coupling factor transporter transmembrane protein EcfT|uniref:hypothetical protein n=1 Tax=Acidithiobacillus caldus TaxID=33059 RepID=UPI0007D8ECCF|nr:hypothetical protein [Acidithiobacillus caldus]AUW32585.1 hypothetical protein A5904_06120 [Acidithiobacillus caldus]MBU2762694.1 hypothetical protein [Acidithiobacillus caldus]MBU2769850.1 hypothetical protein [Acidithiobacillus caldus]QER44705.1 hypothetical protein F0726_01636 [Acidithiobacillus caldus]WMT47942.1 MAG: hypothetical protein RE468_04855 [Acidithiobacillus caldus]